MGETTLPGFRFHPTEEELLGFYLNRAAAGIKLPSEIIGFLNIYHHDPCELPGLAKINGEREWYFFVHRDRKKGHGGRPNRTTKNGFWKATGSDRHIRSLNEPRRVLGLKKTLVFYTGRAPRGSKTDWVMNEYRLPDNHSSLKEDVVLCKIYRKATSLKTIEQRAVMEDLTRVVGPNSPSSQSQESPEDNCAESAQQSDSLLGLPRTKQEEMDIISPSAKLGSLKYCNWMELESLDVPKFSMDLANESLWAQLRSPWLDYWSPGAFTNLLNYCG